MYITDASRHAEFNGYLFMVKNSKLTILLITWCAKSSDNFAKWEKQRRQSVKHFSLQLKQHRKTSSVYTKNNSKRNLIIKNET